MSAQLGTVDFALVASIHGNLVDLTDWKLPQISFHQDLMNIRQDIVPCTLNAQLNTQLPFRGPAVAYHRRSDDARNSVRDRLE
jgi:hypothetical protein